MSCALCSLVNALDFHRAVYLELDSPSSMLRGKFYYGHEPPIPLEGILVRVETRRTYEVSPIIKAFWEKQAVFMGEPLFEGDWPFVAIPMIRYDQVIGVVYADRLEKVKAQPLDLKEQLVLTAIAEELHQIPLMFS